MTSPIDTRWPDIRMQRIMTELEKSSLELVKDCEFVETDVYLDGREFRNCSFRHCNLFIKIGHFRITGPRIHLESCNFKLDGPAQAIKSLADLVSGQAK